MKEISKHRLIDKIRSLRRDLDEAVEELDKNWDEEYERLRRIEEDWTTHDGKTTYYTLIRIQHCPEVAQGTNLEDWWTFDVSDGWCRTGGSAKSLQEALERTNELAAENMQTNIKGDFRHNRKEEK